MAREIPRRSFLQSSFAAAASTALPRLRWPRARTPNILFILADDLGYGDLSCYGRPDYRTPNIDRLAGEGLRFTSNYTAAAVCSPTRVALMTGRYPARLPVGLKEPLIYGDNSVGLPPEHPTPASLLKAAGYETALIGKWHLGFLPEHGPIGMASMSSMAFWAPRWTTSAIARRRDSWTCTRETSRWTRPGT